MADDSRESVEENTAVSVEGSSSDEELVNDGNSEETVKTFKDLVGLSLKIF